MEIQISAESPDTPDAAALIAELEAFLVPLYPAESRHGFSSERLIHDQVAFFVIRTQGGAAGCGGIKLFGSAYGEVKRMFVRPQFRGRGLAKAMLHHLEAYAREHAVERLRLETGIYQVEAVGLYEHMGFYRIPPFGEYRPDPLSLFFEKPVR